MSRRTYWTGSVFFLLLTLYVGSYLYSLRGKGFKPRAPRLELMRFTFHCRKTAEMGTLGTTVCVWFYWPLIKVD